jgi:glycosyltransferase involved in cell wall biosynthesis
MSSSPVHRPIRVGFVVHVMQVAGAEVLIREIITRLGDQIQPTVFCLDRLGVLGEEMITRGGDVICLNRQPNKLDFVVSRRLAREATARRIEVLHAHQYTPFFYAAVAKLFIRPRPKVILTEHGRHYPDHVSPHRRMVNRLILDYLADEVNACIGFSARALCRVDGFRGNRIVVIDNGIEVDRYGPAENQRELRVRLGLEASRRYIVHVARHHPVKDQATLLRGFALVAADVPDVDLLMVGDGPLRGELELLASSLGVARRVRFLGIRKDVPEVLRAADVFALTSVSEAASLTLLEAMATGLPVVVSAVGGNPDIVRDGVDGLLFPRGDAAGCAAAFRRLLTEQGLAHRLGANARQRTHERYRLETTVEKYHALYRKLSGV